MRDASQVVQRPPRERPEFARRRHHFMEHGLSAAGSRSPSKARAPSGARRSCPFVALELGAHQPDGRLPMDSLRFSGQISFGRSDPFA